MLFCHVWGLAAATTDLVPGGPGDTFTQAPFGWFDTPMRMQQVYEAGALDRSMPEGGWITGVWFVADEAGTSWLALIPQVEFSIGLTYRGADELSANFADNFSLAPSVVRPGGELTASSDGPGSVVKINFATPYLYDPSAGNLLLEIKTLTKPETQLTSGGALDAWNVTGDAVSRVYARGDANATVGTVDTIGLTTLFVFTAVPEPSKVALLALGAGALGWRSWRRRQHR